MTRHETTRRAFLQSSGRLAATGAALTYFPWSETLFANDSQNDRPIIGCIGLGGQGTGDAHEHSHFGDIVAVCDVDSRHAERARHNPEIGKGKADVISDYRRILDRADIDVVCIATPDHWHTKIAIEALQAGKHVFCQKPLTLTLEENQLIRRACLKHSDKVFMVGTQQRGDRDLFLRAVNMVQNGLLGKIEKITVGIDGGSVGGPFAKTQPPQEFDWNAWLGQAPLVDFITERSHGNFRWWYEYSGGKFTDWGAHHVDIALWAIGEDGAGKGPLAIDGTDAKHPVPFEAGYPTRDDSYNTAHDYAVKCRYASGLEMVITSRGDNGVLFEGTMGRMFVNRGKIAGTPIDQKWDEGHFGPEDLVRLYKGKPFEGHKQNFFRCVREGGLPVSDVFTHLQTMNTCHLTAIAARLNREIKWDPAAEKIVGDEQAASFFARQPREGIARSRAGGRGLKQAPRS